MKHQRKINVQNGVMKYTVKIYKINHNYLNLILI